MACPSISTGNAFLQDTLAHIDCQAQTLGSFGFLGLSAPGSAYASLLTGLLAIFIALFGYRLLFGQDKTGRDVVTGFIKIGIVLALATSWSAYRTIVYDTVLHGPAEVASVISGSSGLPGSNGNLASRLQRLDDGILDLTALGSGRLSQVPEASGNQKPVQFEQISVGDEFALGFARISYLVGTIGSLALLRISGGLLLAIAPLFSGFLLFEATRGLFMGWVRALALVALGSLGVTIVLAVEIALVEPWLFDALSLRYANYAAPAAPSELLAMTLAFSITLFAIIVVMGRVAFFNVMTVINQGRSIVQQSSVSSRSQEPAFANTALQTGNITRASQIVQSIEAAQRREAGGLASVGAATYAATNNSSSDTQQSAARSYSGRTGSTSGRRTGSRVSRAGQMRDKKS